jgi:hypothetical protein
MPGRLIIALGLCNLLPATAQISDLTPSEIVAKYKITGKYDEKVDGDLAPLWKSLRLSPFISHYGKPEDSNHCHGGCFAELYPGRDATNDQVVRICTTQYNGPCRYLYFRRDARSAKWHLLGSVDDSCTHGPLGMRFENRFWVVSLQDGYGTGIFGKVDRWLVETPNGWQPSFESASEGHWDLQHNWIARVWSAHPIAVEFDPQTSRPKRVELEYEVGFSVNPLGDLFDISRNAVYVPESSGWRMHLDAEQSELTQRDIRDFFSTDTLDIIPPDRFLRFAFQPMLAIAGGPESPKRAWLRGYLATDVPQNTPEKRRLLEALTRNGR